MNKKAQGTGYTTTGDAIRAIVMLGFAAIFATVLVILVNQHVVDILTAENDVDLFLTREAARHCFLHKSQGRVYYQTVDPSLITEANLKKCMPDIPVTVRLEDMNGKLVVPQASTGGAGTVGSYKINVLGSKEVHNLVVIT